MWGVLVSYMMASDIFSSLVIGPDSFVYCLQLLQVLTRFSGFNRKAMMMIKLTRPLMKLRQNRFWQLLEGEGLLLLTGTKFTPDDKLHYTQMKLICRMFSSQLYARVLQKTAVSWHVFSFSQTPSCVCVKQASAAGTNFAPYDKPNRRHLLLGLEFARICSTIVGFGFEKAGYLSLPDPTIGNIFSTKIIPETQA